MTFPTAKNKQDRFYCTYFRWGTYDLQLQECTDGKWYYMGTSIRNTEWVGGTAMADASAALPTLVWSRCVPYLAGSVFRTSKSTAITWTNGVSLSVPMLTALGGVNLSSRTAFTTTARNVVRFTKKGRICGSTGGLRQPGTVMARKYKV